MTPEILVVPTYGPGRGPDECRNRRIGLRREESGIRLVLDENGTGQEHDLLIERHDDKWLLLLHTNGADPVLAVEVHADRLTVTDGMSRPLLSVSVDNVTPAMSCPVSCEICQEVYDEVKGDGYCGMCPACADASEIPYYCESCGFQSRQEDFWPSNGNPAPLVCPRCGRTNCFTWEEPT